MRLSLAAAAFALVSLAAPAALAETNLTGQWQGGYVSDDSGADANTFTLTITGKGRAFTGTGVELNVFGDAAKALFLTSDIAGTIDEAGRVTMVKTYDGAGGVSHSVRYVGQLDASGRRVQGAYDAGGATGRFEMVR